jgi:RNA polymerase sigma-70 factor, ECF subfamily
MLYLLLFLFREPVTLSPDQLRFQLSEQLRMIGRCAVNLIIHLTREQVKTKAEAAFYERTQAALCEVDYARFEELDRKIKEAMAALPDSYREAFVMHRFKELSYKEIAEVLDVSPQTVAYRIQQALKLLRVSLKDYLPMLVWLVG